MTPDRRQALFAALLALAGACGVLAAVTLDFWTDGAPGIGATQILGMGVGFAMILVADGIVRRRSGGPGASDIPWILGAASLVAASVVIVVGPKAPPPDDDFRDNAVGRRLLDLERSVLAPRRTELRCYPATDEVRAEVTFAPVISGLTQPVYVTTADDGSRRLFVVEKGGAIRIAKGNRLLDEPFLDIRGKVYSPANPSARPSDPEQGLLSVAFPPDFEATGRFYVYYTGFPDGLIHLSRFEVSGDPDRADPETEQVLLTVPTVGPIHNAGQLQFGPRDGYLYVAVGDGGGWRWPTGDSTVYGDGAVEISEDGEVIIPPGSGFTEEDILTADQWNQAQDPGTLRGTILRLDVDVDSTYAIPADNPFVDDGDEQTRGEIWAYGLRNPWRFSFDDCDGALFAADVGQSRYEEINLIEPGGNYGWRVMEGAECYREWYHGKCDPREFEFPIVSYPHLSLSAGGGNAVVGGYVYRGSRLPTLVGRYVFSDWMSARVWTLTPTPHSTSGWRMDHLATMGFLPTSFGLDADDELLVTGYGGTVYRMVPETGIRTD